MSKRRRILIILALVAGISVSWEARRALFALWLWKGHFALVERWAGDQYFGPALRMSILRRQQQPWRSSELCDWATHRYSRWIEGNQVSDLALTSSGELLLLVRTPVPETVGSWNNEEVTIVVFASLDSAAPVARSEFMALNGDSFTVQEVPAWEGQGILIYGGGSLNVVLAYRKRGDAFLPLPCRYGSDGMPYFMCRGDVFFADLDRDGIPEVVTTSNSGICCPACGQESESILRIWKLVGNDYLLWMERGTECGPACELTGPTDGDILSNVLR